MPSGWASRIPQMTYFFCNGHYGTDYLNGAKGDDTLHTGNDDGARDLANRGHGRDSVFYKGTRTVRNDGEVKREYE
jgi:hypothetical protein